MKRRWRDLYSAYERQLLFGALVLLLLLSLTSNFRAPEAQTVSQQTIDSAVQRTLAEQVLPSPAAKVFAAVHGAIVQVRTNAPQGEFVDLGKLLGRRRHLALEFGIADVQTGLLLQP